MKNVSSYFSDDYIISKVLKHIGVTEIAKSKIDNNTLIKVFLNDYNLNNIRKYFHLSEAYTNKPFYYNKNVIDKQTVAKIIGFSSDEWKNIVNLKELRKEKLEKINGLSKA